MKIVTRPHSRFPERQFSRKKHSRSNLCKFAEKEYHIEEMAERHIEELMHV